MKGWKNGEQAHSSSLPVFQALCDTTDTIHVIQVDPDSHSKESYGTEINCERYDAAKQQVAQQVLDLLEQRFPGISTAAIQGRKAVQTICRRDGRRFVTTIP